MSLVAYGASDDSDASEGDEATISQTTIQDGGNDKAFADDGKISDEDDYVPTENSERSLSRENNFRYHQTLHTPSSLSDLPAPKPIALSSSQDDSQNSGEDELEEEVKPKASQVADAPKPPPKKSKQLTRIVLPALQQDSDDEEEDSKKKQKPTASSESGSGLFALLPAPVHGTKKQTNRPLIPHTLTKRSTASSPSKPVSKPTSAAESADADSLPSQKHLSAFNALTGYESDSDEEESDSVNQAVNYFAIDSEAGRVPVTSMVKDLAPLMDLDNKIHERTADSDEKEKSDVAHNQTVSEFSVSSSAQGSASSTSKSASSETSSSVEITQDSVAQDSANNEENEVTSTIGIPQSNQDAPLTFNSSMQGRGWSVAPLVSPMLPEMYAAPSSSSAVNYWQRQQQCVQDYSTEEEEDTDSAAGSSNDNVIQQYMEDEQFLRISGKRKRGPEDIQIIDANVDDCVDPGDLMKGISEESSYQPHRKKDNMPSTQQRRKKQITYLAFQAKERELELKNVWSQNRNTKKQARSKYGF